MARPLYIGRRQGIASAGVGGGVDGGGGAGAGLETLSIGGVQIGIGGQTMGVPKTAPSFTLAGPSAYQVIQRDGTNHADIVIAGSYTGRNGVVMARWGEEGEEDWEVIDAAPVNGIFVGVIRRPVGQRRLYVRISTGAVTSADFVGIGDIFAVWGQSNGDGRGADLNSYSHPTLKACVLKKSNLWEELTDPSGGGPGQVDSVSNDPESAGSLWPLVASIYMLATGIPVAFVPCCRGGQGNFPWRPQADHFDRSTLYGSALYRTLTLAGGCRMIIYYGGEPGVSAAVSDYSVFLPIAQAIAADLGVPVMRVKLQYCNTGRPEEAAEAAGVAAAVQHIWDNPGTFNSVIGPDLSDIVADDGYHLVTFAKVFLAAQRTAARLIAYS